MMTLEWPAMKIKTEWVMKVIRKMTIHKVSEVSGVVAENSKSIWL